jgi:hypothetical protein
MAEIEALGLVTMGQPKRLKRHFKFLPSFSRKASTSSGDHEKGFAQAGVLPVDKQLARLGSSFLPSSVFLPGEVGFLANRECRAQPPCRTSVYSLV